MEQSKGPTYTRYGCCLKGRCLKFESMLEVGDCYAEGGSVVKSCMDCMWRTEEFRTLS